VPNEEAASYWPAPRHASPQIVMNNPGRTVNFQPHEGALESLGVTKAEFDQEVFKAFLDVRDCQISPGDLPVYFNGRHYRLAEVAHIQAHDNFS